MIDEVKLQELKDAAAHAKHNGGRVSVECGDVDDLLNTWKAANTAPGQPPEQPEAGGIPIPPLEPVAAPEPEPEAPSDTPEPTIQ